MKIRRRERAGKSEFKQLQALKKRAYQAFADGKRLDVPDQDAAHLDSINLAFVGDAYYALTLRRRLVETGIPHVQVLHTLAAEFVSAKAQAYVYRRIHDGLTDDEKASASGPAMPIPWRRRAPPSPSTTTARPGSLVGYLVMAGRTERLDAVMAQVYEETKAYCNEKHGGME